MAVRYTRAERLAQIRTRQRLHPEWTRAQIAADIGLSLSGVREVLSDPDGSKKRAKVARYRGTCIDCGGATDGSAGPSKPAARCKPCRNKFERGQKVWTADAVTDAIRRFAADNGRPPTSTEWISGNQELHYPPISSVYRPRHGRRGNQPFASWADAIEAAGFPRPLIGHWQINPRPGDRRAA